MKNLNWRPPRAELLLVRLREASRRLVGVPIVVAWGIGVLFGSYLLVRYQFTPAALAAAPTQWPQSVSFDRSTSRLTLIMLVHPQCPCSRASMAELSELMARAAGRIDAHVLFVQPSNAPANWLDGDLWKSANAISGVKVQVDKDGQDAAAFGAATSGQVLVYDTAGAIRFSGGITDGRGHQGDNVGLDSILELVRHGRAPVATTPVYGCSLGECRNVRTEGNGS